MPIRTPASADAPDSQRPGCCDFTDEGKGRWSCNYCGRKLPETVSPNNEAQAAPVAEPFVPSSEDMARMRRLTKRDPPAGRVADQSAAPCDDKPQISPMGTAPVPSSAAADPDVAALVARLRELASYFARRPGVATIRDAAAAIEAQEKRIEGLERDRDIWYRNYGTAADDLVDARIALDDSKAREAARMDKVKAALAASAKDAERLDWLQAHPREATIRIDGDIKPCVFYGVSCDPKWSAREAIDAALAAGKGEG